jgi:Protein of unknown function (DUF3562)
LRRFTDSTLFLSSGFRRGRVKIFLQGDDLMAARIRYPSAPKNDRVATEALAKETDTSLEEVEKLYEEELEGLASDAKITQYLGVLASRRVRMRLRKH